jgi:hypothetical protein
MAGAQDSSKLWTEGVQEFHRKQLNFIGKHRIKKKKTIYSKGLQVDAIRKIIFAIF